MILTRWAILLLLFTLALNACKPKKRVEPTPEPAPSPTLESPFDCKAIPAAPTTFGWQDSTGNVDNNINTFMYNPANPDEAVLVVNGDIFGYNKLICYNIRSGKRTYIASLGPYIPSINERGWILYSTVDNNIFKVKCNGDSLKQLTSGNTTRHPQWNHTGNAFYYYQAPYSNVPSLLVKIAANGGTEINFPLYMANSAVFKNSDKIIYQKIINNSVTLILRDMLTSTERSLISGPFKNEVIYFNDLCLDNEDANFYWSNESGIFKCSLSTLKVDTFLKSCPSIIYDSPVFQKKRPNEVLMACHFVKPLPPYLLLHAYKAVQMDLTSREKKIIDFFAD